jgi:hypothetical protein
MIWLNVIIGTVGFTLFCAVVVFPILSSVFFSLKAIFSNDLEGGSWNALVVPVAVFCLFSSYGFAVAVYFFLDYLFNL